ncbi:hypothetical protein A2U01_0094335, partial [Trifolium medium]|nr:hypothetical protein [Trifolium medium]
MPLPPSTGCSYAKFQSLHLAPSTRAPPLPVNFRRPALLRRLEPVNRCQCDAGT